MMALFHRLAVDDWQNKATIAVMLFFFVLFLVITIRALFLSKKDSDHLSGLPLENESPHPISKHGQKH